MFKLKVEGMAKAKQARLCGMIFVLEPRFTQAAECPHWKHYIGKSLGIHRKQDRPSGKLEYPNEC